MASEKNEGGQGTSLTGGLHVDTMDPDSRSCGMPYDLLFEVAIRLFWTCSALKGRHSSKGRGSGKSICDRYLWVYHYLVLLSQISSYPRACTYLVSSYVPHPTWLLYGVYGVVAVSVSKAVCHVTMYSASVPKKKVWRVLVFLHFPSSRKLGSNKSQVPSPKFLQDQVCAVPISLHLRRCNNNKHGFSCSHHVLICCLQVHVQPSPTAGAHQTTRSHHP